MRYIKTFENNKSPEFKVGDFVYADNTQNSLTLDKNIKYEIIDVISPTQWQSYKYELKEFPGEHFSEYRFISEMEYDAKKYNL